jgi:hypothetical protein
LVSWQSIPGSRERAMAMFEGPNRNRNIIIAVVVIVIILAIIYFYTTGGRVPGL